MILVSSMPSLLVIRIHVAFTARVREPVSHQFGQLRMAIASEKLYRIRRHGWRCYFV